jgi:hypothetical protein
VNPVMLTNVLSAKSTHASRQFLPNLDVAMLEMTRQTTIGSLRPRLLHKSAHLPH